MAREDASKQAGGSDANERTIHLSSGPITYQVRPSARARRVRLVVRPGGALEVVKPRGVSQARIEETLRHYEAWILRTQARLAPLAPPLASDPLTDGRALPYMGRSLRLTLMTSANGARAARITLHSDQLALALPASAATMAPVDRDPLVRDLLERWYRRQARTVFEERLIYWNVHYNLSWASVAIKAQKTRWGSCSRRGNLNFNWRLLLAPPAILDYVVIHELCHLQEHNHAAAFWALVERACPDYRDHRRWLRLHGHELAL
ncbi:MAG TPA: SprT family zinc-dependent metalloprotease [Ktedonobacterales bacterium]|nr:SprT family zinc-dependent metalloprotease [Ktedonobacterales bacterium]